MSRTTTSSQQHTCQIIPFQMEITSRQQAYLTRWVQAAQPMGICDADVFVSEQKQAGVSAGYVVVWVRETPDPAYQIYCHGNRWVVMDAIRDNKLGCFNTFADALNMIRPVMPREQGIVAA